MWNGIRIYRFDFFLKQRINQLTRIKGNLNVTSQITNTLSGACTGAVVEWNDYYNLNKWVFNSNVVFYFFRADYSCNAVEARALSGFLKRSYQYRNGFSESNATLNIRYRLIEQFPLIPLDKIGVEGYSLSRLCFRYGRRNGGWCTMFKIHQLFHN